MPYELMFSIMVLTALMFWGRFVVRRQNAGRREFVEYAGATGNLAEYRPLHFDMHVPLRRIPVFATQLPNHGAEYYFHSRLGLLSIVPKQNLPTAVELRIGGKVLGSYISAEFAAHAVGAGLTNHKELDALSAENRPTKLGDWEQSRPHHFRT